MIKSFKIFERYHNPSKELVDQFDDEFIDEYFDKHCLMDAEQIIDLWPSSIWQFIDDNKYIEDFIRGEISSLSIDDFSDYDYKNYIINNITYEKELKVIDFYNKLKNKNETIYDHDMVEDLTEEQLREIIESENEEEDFVEYNITDRYENMTAKDIIDEMYGSRIEGDELYKIFTNYIDDDEIVEHWKGETDKGSEIQENISGSPELQNKLLDIDKANVILLAKLFTEETYGNNNSKKYKFQKLFITEYVKEHADDNTDDYLRAEAIKYLHDKFGLNAKIEKEYSDDMWLISSDRYNL